MGRLLSILSNALAVIGFIMVVIGLFIFAQLATVDFRAAGLAAIPLLIVSIAVSTALFILGNILFLASIKLGGLLSRILSPLMALATGGVATLLAVVTINLLIDGTMSAAAFGAVITLVLSLTALYYVRTSVKIFRG